MKLSKNKTHVQEIQSKSISIISDMHLLCKCRRFKAIRPIFLWARIVQLPKRLFDVLIHFYQRDVYRRCVVYKNLVFFEITGRSLTVVVAEAERFFGNADRIRV